MYKNHICVHLLQQTSEWQDNLKLTAKNRYSCAHYLREPLFWSWTVEERDEFGLSFKGLSIRSQEANKRRQQNCTYSFTTASRWRYKNTQLAETNKNFQECTTPSNSILFLNESFQLFIGRKHVPESIAFLLYKLQWTILDFWYICYTQQVTN
jgi:hypothetical protein